MLTECNYNPDATEENCDLSLQGNVTFDLSHLSAGTYNVLAQRQCERGSVNRFARGHQLASLLWT